MNRIDRLLIQARAVTRTEMLPSFICQDGDSWTAETYFRNSVHGHSPTVKTATYATQAAAVEHIRTLADEYPNSRDVVVIIDDM